MTDVTANDGSWTFLCASWASRGGLWKIYKNGALADHGQGLAEGLVVGDAGTLVLGQEQDSPGLVNNSILPFSFDISKSRISGKKSVFNKSTIKV